MATVDIHWIGIIKHQCSPIAIIEVGYAHNTHVWVEFKWRTIRNNICQLKPQTLAGLGRNLHTLGRLLIAETNPKCDAAFSRRQPA
jgi:hypothetical protein